MEKSLRFYRDFLGLQVEIDQNESGAFIEGLLDIPGVRVRTVKLSTAEGPTLIELLQFADRHGVVENGEQLSEIRRLGPTHTALTVSDLNGLYEKLCVEGISHISPPKLSADRKALVMFCSDPDGALLELVEPTNKVRT